MMRFKHEQKDMLIHQFLIEFKRKEFSKTRYNGIKNGGIAECKKAFKKPSVKN
jgi:hypothetical protein